MTVGPKASTESKEVCVCVCVCVSKWKRECQTNGKHDKRKSQAQWKEKYRIGRGPFRQSSHCHPDKRKRERDYLLNLHMSQSTCFGTWIETGVDFYGWQWVPRASTVQKREHVKDNRAKRSNVEVTSIIGVGGRLLSCVRRVLSYTWHRERHVELLVMYDQTFGTRTLLAHAQRRRKEKEKKKKKKKSKLKERRKKK